MSMAIKYAMQKKARSRMCQHGNQDCPMCHGGEMAEGGDVAPPPPPPDDRRQRVADSLKKAFGHADGGFIQEEEASGYEPMPEEGGYDMSEHHEESPEEDHDIVSRIMAQRSKHYSHGGRVANDSSIRADFEKNDFDDLALGDAPEEHYTGANSGDELSDEQEDEDRRDIVKRIMRSRMKKDRLPHPA